MSKGYIYIGQYFHYHGKDLGIDEKKIGKTINLEKREIQLSKTNSTIGYTYIAAWEVEDMHMIETTLHSLLSATRLDANGRTTEWFEDPDDSLVESVRGFMINLNLGKEVDLGISNEKEEEAIKKQATTKFSVNYNGKDYNMKGNQILINVCNDMIEDGLDVNPNTGYKLIYNEPQCNPRNGHDYTRLLNNNKRVYVCMSNKHKAMRLKEMADRLGVELTVNYEYIER